MCLNWKKVRLIVGNFLIAFFGALLGYTFQLKWENRFIYVILFIVLGIVLTSWDND